MKSSAYTFRTDPHRRLPNLAMLVLSLLALAACATVPQNTDALVTRAQARWDALIAGEYEQAYAYYSPGFRSTMSLTDFTVDMRLKRIKWIRATYHDHSCQEQVCTVRFDLDYEAPRPVPGVAVWKGKDLVEDTWVQTSGEWWYVPKK